MVKTIENFILNNGYNFTDSIDKNQIHVQYKNDKFYIKYR